MPLLQFNGVTVTSLGDSVEETPEDIGEVDERGLVGNIVRQRTGRLRSWRFDTPPLEGNTARALRRWLEGEGQSWDFKVTPMATASSEYSSLYVTASIAGTYSTQATGGPFNARMTVNSGSKYGVRMQNRLGVQRRGGWDPTVDGWTWIGWRKWTAAEDGGGVDVWRRFVMTGAVAFSQGSSANPVGVTQYKNGVAGSYGYGNAFGVSLTNPYVALHGKSLANANRDVDFGDMRFLPYQIPAAWVPQIDAEMALRELSRFPTMQLRGDFLGDEPGPVLVVCKVRAISQMVGDVARNGSSVATNRILQVEMRETM